MHCVSPLNCGFVKTLMEAMNEQKETIEALQKALGALNEVQRAQLIVIENGVITTHLN